MSQFAPTFIDWDAIAMAVGIIFVVVAVFGWLAWNRYLYHKELMKLPDAGRDSREALRMKERWRMRQGLLSGAKLLALGVALAVIANKCETVAGRRLIGPPEMVLLLGAGVFLFVMGTITLTAYAIWSRRDAGLLEGERKEISETTRDIQQEGGE